MDNYQKIIQTNLSTIFKSKSQEDLALDMSAQLRSGELHFSAFGGECRLAPDGILLDGEMADGVIGILVSLYALHAAGEPCRLEPLTSFKELPDSMPYWGAYASHTEQILVPHVEQIEADLKRIVRVFNGEVDPLKSGGDFAFLLYPLPKVGLYYIFYRADDDFPASAKCLFSANVTAFLPIDAIADVGEYTSKKIVELLEKSGQTDNSA